MQCIYSNSNGWEWCRSNAEQIRLTAAQGHLSGRHTPLAPHINPTAYISSVTFLLSYKWVIIAIMAQNTISELISRRVAP
ncbi:hypothetical protein CLV98_109156 [Dyadobacter jejuensis]|uniref:Uncharacterized protein n=1 Tax=Dyadobacter jejuensis TaxID=1082580 RepID=A0A316AGW2_9BACT|nr:hypothetical protein [Dyadobacter jejuensis]PWJ57046.1 hypothetical protein CLV98_109156 [Dyadobacter jejuensis]